jgi:hypothetical protein
LPVTVLGWTLLMWTQLFLVGNVHQKYKLFSGKCLRYFTPAALPRREEAEHCSCGHNSF